MARPSTSGLPFLVSRGDSKKFSYWRIFPKAVGPHLVGSIERPWTHAPFALTGKAIIKLSLNTTDQAIAQARWAQVHGQVETLHRKALDLAGETNARSRARRTATLTSAEIAGIAEQTRHDMLAAHDAEWINPDDAGSMSSVANGLLAAMRGSGADETPQARERAQALGRRLESAAVRASLADRSLGNLDSAPTLLALTGEYAGDGRKAGDRARHARTAEVEQAAPDDFRSSRSAEQVAAILRAQAVSPGSRWSVGETIIAQDHGELARRLAENGIDLADDSPDRRKLGLAILRAKAGALRDIAERDRGGGIATPARPEPINLPPAPHDRRAAPGGVHRRRAAPPAARRALRLCHDAGVPVAFRLRVAARSPRYGEARRRRSSRPGELGCARRALGRFGAARRAGGRSRRDRRRGRSGG